MTTVVACSLPSGLIIEHKGAQVRLNGAHVGSDMENLQRNGALEDSAQRASGYGLTTLDGKEEGAFLAWADGVMKGPDGEELQHPFEPIANGALKWSKSEKDARASVKDGSLAVPGVDPAKDLPEGLETADKKD